MKNKNQRAVLLGIALLGATTLVGLGAANADERDRRNDHKQLLKEDRRDVKDAKKDVGKERRDVYRADTPQQKRQQMRELLEAQHHLNAQKRDLKNDSNRFSNRDRDHDRDRNRPGYGRPNTLSSSRHIVLRGTVINMHSRNMFDISAGGRTYDIYATGSTPRALSHGDGIEVSGFISNGNDIHDAKVSLLRNR